MNRREAFRQIRNFAVHYGRNQIPALRQFDLAIIEPSAHDATDIDVLQSNNTLVLAYVTVMEVGPHHPQWTQLTEDDFIKADGQVLMQSAYGTSILDLTSTRWRGMLFHTVGELMMRRRYDGIFLDTIGDVEMPSVTNPTAQMTGAVDIVRTLRNWFPDAIMVQNNGLELLVLDTAPYIDGLVCENPPLHLKSADAWNQRIGERLHELEQQYGLKTLLLFDGIEVMPRKDWILRRRFGDVHQFPTYFAQTHYIGDVPL